MIVSFQDFLELLHNSSFWNSTRIFCFQGQDFPPLFFSQLFNHVTQKQLLPYNFQYCSLHGLSKNSLLATINQSFLGSSTFYWLGNIESAEKYYKELAQDLSIYEGPNIIAFFASHDVKFKQHSNMEIIHIDSTINYEFFLYLQKAFAISLVEIKKQLLRKIFKIHPTLSLDTACMLLHYIELMSAKVIAQSENYLFSLLAISPSLTQLSEYFFAKNAEKFFALWTTMHHEYPDIFWITFWSDHLWRAYNVLVYLARNDFVQAKKMSYRLPYSFLKKDWKQHSIEDLIKRFEFIYSIDYALKRGSSFPALDFFYTYHFHNNFPL